MGPTERGFDATDGARLDQHRGIDVLESGVRECRAQFEGGQRVEAQIRCDARLRPDRICVDAFHARDEVLDWGLSRHCRTGRSGSGRCPRCLLGTEPFEDRDLSYLERRGTRKVLLRPDGEFANLLVGRELSIRRAHHVGRVRGLS